VHFRLIALTVVLALHNDVLSTCTDGTLLRVYYIGMVILLIAAIILSAAIAYVSSRGTITDSTGRKCVSPLLLARVFLSVLDIAWTAIGTRWAFVEVSCTNDVVIVVRCVVIVGWLLVLALIVGVTVVFDPLGHQLSETDPGQESERLWKTRYIVIFCQSFQPALLGVVLITLRT
jgi:uncharacterized metal-binding protein